MDEWRDAERLILFGHEYQLSLANYTTSMVTDKYDISLERLTLNQTKLYFRLHTYVSKLKHLMTHQDINLVPHEFINELHGLHRVYLKYQERYNFENFSIYMEDGGFVLEGTRRSSSLYEVKPEFIVGVKKSDGYYLSNKSSKVFKRFLVASQLLGTK